MLTPSNFSSAGLSSPFYIDSFTFYVYSVDGYVAFRPFVYEWDANTREVTGAPIFAGSAFLPITLAGPVKVDTAGAGPLDPSKSYILFWAFDVSAEACAIPGEVVVYINAFSTPPYTGFYSTGGSAAGAWNDGKVALALEAVFSYYAHRL